jgi:hypothetical protein
VVETCEALCKRSEAECDEASARKCRATCKIYVSLGERCAAPVTDALACQAKAERDAVCSNIAAASCLIQFRAMKACERGEAAQPETPRAEETVPTSWTRVKDEVLGFSIALPSDAVAVTEERVKWRATEGEVTYEVAHLPAPRSQDLELADRDLVRLALAHIGFGCQRGLRLHGRLDRDGSTAARFDSSCNDKSEWHGMVRVWNGKAISTAAHVVSGDAVQAPFFYSFELTP